MKRLCAIFGFLSFLFPQACMISQNSSHGEERWGPSLRFSDRGNRTSLLRGIDSTKEFLRSNPSGRTFPLGRHQITASGLAGTLTLFKSLFEKHRTDSALSKMIKKNFDIIQLNAKSGASVLFTGYYEPVLEARLVRDKEFRHPIYRKPDDLVELVVEGSKRGSGRAVGRMKNRKLIPYYTRSEIDGQKLLAGRGLEIAWIRDPVSLFFLHVQGSGILQLKNGERRRVHYDGSNGRPYRSIGKFLKDSNRVPPDGLSMQSIRRYLQDHPAEREEVLHQNESYIFFRFVKEGPIGNLGVPLIPERSIAIDPSVFPKGALTYFVTERPRVDPDSGRVTHEPFSRFALTHDVGSAIQGPRRVDVFLGTGNEAEEVAGRMMAKGTLYVLVKKGTLRKRKG